MVDRSGNVSCPEYRCRPAHGGAPDRALLDPDVRWRAARGADLDARGRRPAACAGDPRIHPLSQARPRGRAGRNHPSLFRRPRLCRGQDRHPGVGRFRGSAAGRIPGAGPRRRRRGDRLDRGPGLVRRHCRNDGTKLGRVRGASGRRAPATTAQGHYLARFGRRPLRRRHALQGRLPAERQYVLAPAVLLAAVAAARSHDRRRWLARHVVRASGEPDQPDPGVAAPPEARSILEARFGVRGLRRHRVPGLPGRRLGGQLHQLGARPARAPAGSPQGPDRAVGSPVPAGQGAAGALDGVPSGSAALVGPLVEGRRHRHHGRAHVPGMDGRDDARRGLHRRDRRPLDRRSGLAARPGDRIPHLAYERDRPRAGTGPGLGGERRVSARNRNRQRLPVPLRHDLDRFRAGDGTSATTMAGLWCSTPRP